jgi:hypothetical protein
MYVKLRKERDYHRMHHKRVVQEKNKLIDDIKRLKRHYAQFEPTLQSLKTKYEVRCGVTAGSSEDLKFKCRGLGLG